MNSIIHQEAIWSYPLKLTGEFIHHDTNLWFELIRRLEQIFANHPETIRIVRQKAEALKTLIDELDYSIQSLTNEICPSCEQVCCINQHSYPDQHDLLYLIALNEAPPNHDPHHNDREPCRFLSHSGCSLARSKRPFRCNWYFCSSLLSYMTAHSGAATRKLSQDLQNMIDKRREMIEAFIDATEGLSDISSQAHRLKVEGD